jgi:type I restriction enzyme, S subunit
LILKEHEGFAFGAFMTVFRSEMNRFLIHIFKHEDYKKQVHRNLGATINSINNNDLKKFKFLFPSKKEQQKIASFLSSIDNKIEITSTQLEKTREFKKGLLQQMFV